MILPRPTSNLRNCTFYQILTKNYIIFAYFISHKEGIVVEKDPKLQVFYTKMAAELGLAEAQHNLGCMYMEKILVPYNGVKAMAWLT